MEGDQKMTEQMLKKLNAKIDLIDKKLDTIMEHLNIKIKKPKRVGLPAKSLIQGFGKQKP